LKSHNVFWIILLIAFIAINVSASAPSVVTNPATLIQVHQATLNGNLNDVGNGTLGIPVTVRQLGHNRCTGTTCAVTLSVPTIANATIVVIVSSFGGSTAPTDDGSNSYSGWGVGDVAGRQLVQTAQPGQSDEPDLIALYNVTNSMQTVTAHNTGNPSGLFVAELSASIPFHTTMTQIINTPTNVYGMSVNSSYGFIIGDLEMNAAADSCQSFAVYEGTKIDTYEGPFLNVECSYLMTNTTGGTRLSMVNSNGIRSGNVIQVSAPFAAAVGFLWDTSPSFGSATNVSVVNLNSPGAFSAIVSSLSAATTYYFKAWGNSTSGYAEGSTLSFSTLPDVARQFGDYGWIFGFLAALMLGMIGAYWIKRRRDEHY